MKVKEFIKAFLLGKAKLMFNDDLDNVQAFNIEDMDCFIDNTPLGYIEENDPILERDLKSWKIKLDINYLDLPILYIFTV